MPYYVYVLASRRHGTLYIGVTNDLSRRIEANMRERQLKKWNRDWKIRLIEEQNPEWQDLVDLLV